MNEPLYDEDGARAAALEQFRGSGHEAIAHLRRLNDEISLHVKHLLESEWPARDYRDARIDDVVADLVDEFGEPSGAVETIDDARNHAAHITMAACDLVTFSEWDNPDALQQIRRLRNKLYRELSIHAPKTLGRYLETRRRLEASVV